MTLQGRCHCGVCTVRIPGPPESVTQCNCSLCRATGFRGIYFRSDEIEIAGAFDSYARDDIDEAFLRTFRCKTCGMATHWEPLTEPPHDRMGVNANMLNQADLAGVPVKQVDGASW